MTFDPTAVPGFHRSGWKGNARPIEKHERSYYGGSNEGDSQAKGRQYDESSESSFK